MVIGFAFVTCISAQKEKGVSAKYEFVIENFKLGEHAVTPDQHKYLSRMLMLDIWTAHQFGITFKSGSQLNIWWTDDPEDANGNELNGKWSIRGNVLTFTGVGRYSGKYTILKYDLDYSDRFNKYSLVIVFDRDIGTPGYEDTDLFIEIN